MRRPALAHVLLLLAVAALSGCDQLGIESATQAAARREAEGKAIGAGCRHAARSVEACYALNKKAAEVARAACDRHSTKDKPRFVLGSMGPGTKLVTLGNTTWDIMFDSYREQALGLIDGGTDTFLIETCQDLLQVKCAINAVLAALDGVVLPKALIDSAREAALHEGDATRLGVVQAITAIAGGKATDPDQRFAMERAAGEYLAAA